MNGIAGSQPPTLACLGDSLTGWTDAIAPDYFMGWVQRLQTAMPRRVIANFGVGGFVSSSIAGRWLSAVKNCGYQRITVLAGTNDLTNANPASVVITHLDTIYDQAIALGVEIFALTVTPFFGHAAWNETRQGYLETINAHIATKCSENTSLMTLVDTHEMLKDPGDSRALNPAYDYGDLLHWNSAGHALIADHMKEIGL